jgi:hypothetical protein
MIGVILWIPCSKPYLSTLEMGQETDPLKKLGITARDESLQPLHGIKII